MQPVSLAERYRIIDVIRGVALFGVLMINLLTGFRVSLAAHILEPHSDPGRLNYAVDAISTAVLEFKALTLFSLLFGVGVAIQAERTAQRGVSTSLFLLRRFVVLLGIGLVHFLLIWNGDILTLYAVCGLLMIPLLLLRSRALLAVGICALLLPYFISLPVPFPGETYLRAQAGLATRIYAHGSFMEIARLRIDEAIHLITPLLVGSLPRTLGLMLIGAAIWRSGLLRDPERWRGVLLAILLLGGVIGVAATLTQKHSAETSIMPLSLAYGAGLLLLFARRPSGAIAKAFAAAGQMALTNYLAQSVIFGFVFYSYGLGLFGSMASAPAALLGFAVYAFQLAASMWWLTRYRFGPVEWLWRSLTYGQAQPMLRRAELHEA